MIRLRALLAAAIVKTVWRCPAPLRKQEPTLDLWLTDFHFFGWAHRSMHFPGCDMWAVTWTFRGKYYCNFEHVPRLNSKTRLNWLELRLGKVIWQFGRWKKNPYEGVEVFFNGSIFQGREAR